MRCNNIKILDQYALLVYLKPFFAVND